MKALPRLETQVLLFAQCVQHLTQHNELPEIHDAGFNRFAALTLPEIFELNTPTPEKRTQIPFSHKPGWLASPAHNATKPILHYDAAASGTSLIAVPIPSS